MENTPRYIVKMVSFCLLALSFACSPQKKIQRYSYLFKSSTNPVRPPVKPAATPPRQITHIPKRPAPRIAHPTVSYSNRDVKTVIKTARSYLGTPYRYGGMSKNGIDCSGLVCTSFKAVDKQLPRTSGAMAKTGVEVPRKHLAPGNLIFFSSNNTRHINHVGIIIRTHTPDVEFIHASTSSGVRVDKLNDPYWSKRFRKGVKVY